MAPKRITITDVARECGCSIATVSFVLNGRGKVSAATKKKVLRVASRLGYVPNLAGRNLRTKRSNTVGLYFYPSCAQLFRNVFYAEVMEALERHLGQAGYDLLLCGSDFSSDEGRPTALLTQKRVDAAIMLGAFPAKLIEPLSRLGPPLLLLDSNIDELPIDSVTTDGFSGGRLVVDHLYQRGHRKILMLAYALEDYNIDARTRGFLAGLSEHGLPTRGALIRNFAQHDEVVPALLRQLTAAAAPTAIVCVNDTMAAFITQRLQAEGYKVPKDVSIVGYDDDVYARESLPKLTTVAIDRAELGRIGAELLMRRLNQPDAPVSKARLPVQLVARDSVATLTR